MERLAKSDVSFCLALSGEGRLRLREDHDYYYQVQGELNITKRQVCYFVGERTEGGQMGRWAGYNFYNFLVWSPTEFHYEVIQRDQHFWDLLMYPWLLDFHRSFDQFSLNADQTSNLFYISFRKLI